MYTGTSLAVQWLRLRASTAGGTGSIPDWGTKIPHAAQSGQKKNIIACIQNNTQIKKHYFSKIFISCI